MNRVRLLPEQVANQIAAGEVVERPASVVKELVENSLDAGARRISVDIVAAGRGLIRVTDDGCGMSRDDALLCLERHATSKISAAADLSRITTLGFRGEAIPSIASVSRFTLTTREHGQDTLPGSQVVIHGGRILEVREAGSAPGTTIEIRGLFFNVPARRKFLRSDDTERAHIQHWLTTAALAHPEVAFALTVDGRVVWQLPALPPTTASDTQLQNLRERVRLLLGDGLALIPVEADGQLPPTRVAPEQIDASPDVSPLGAVRIWGWIGAPGVSRGSRDDQHLFVNRRPVENRGLNAALIEGYHNALMKGRYPLGCLFLELDPGEVDVNIHPAKREVKFHRERAIRHFVAEAVRGALKAWHAPGREPVPAIAPVPTAAAPGAAGPVTVPFDFAQRPTPPGSASPDSLPPADLRRVWLDRAASEENPAAPAHPTGTDSRPIATSSSASSPLSAPEPHTAPAPSTATAQPGSPNPLLAIPLRVIGVLGRLYVVLESDRGLVLLDQHAAHERILYEQMLRRLQQGDAAPSQRLLLPETLELSPRDAAFLREHLPALSRMGVGLSEFGERTFLLDALPPFVKSASPRRFGLELVEELRAAGASINSWRLGESVVAKTVCRHAVKANDPLAGPELDALIEDLRRCEMPYTCPHGRPTLIEMSFRELDRKFGRTQ